MICFDSELFPQNFVWQLNIDQKSLELYYECLKSEVVGYFAHIRNKFFGVSGYHQK